MSPVTCSNCRTVYEDGGTSCPKCGSEGRMISLEAETGHYEVMGHTAQLTVTRYPESLLSTARRLFNEGQFSIAVVVAHMACEIATEHSLGEAFRARHISDLEEPIEAFLSGYNLAHEKIGDLYVAMTGDAVRDQPFWPAFKASATRRNHIIHNGAIVSESEADESLQATSKLVAHLMRRGGPTT